MPESPIVLRIPAENNRFARESIAPRATRACRLFHTIAKAASSVPKVTRFIASLATRGARSKAKGQDWTQTLIWLPVSLYHLSPSATCGHPGVARDRPGQSGQMANLSRWPLCPRLPIRPDGQSTQMPNPARWPTCPDDQSGQIANLPRLAICPDGQSAQMANLPTWLIRPDGESARMANPARWPICPDSHSGEMANLPN